MEEKKVHYPIANKKQNGNKNQNYTLIPFNNIIIDKRIHQFLIDNCDHLCNGKNIKYFKSDQSLPLHKLENVKIHFQKKLPLDPIVVQKYKETDRFKIIDGRHRYAISILNQCSHIPCTVIT